MTSLDSKDGAGKTAMGNLRRAMISETCNISNDIDEMRSDLEIVDLCDRGNNNNNDNTNTSDHLDLTDSLDNLDLADITDISDRRYRNDICYKTDRMYFNDNNDPNDHCYCK
ncbi:hypothetical protein C2G38_2203064 [Gigaspora rosea]|uniref:Uncharacterized protein n=1 Tax=Gigaspora rosea TaxID=44941 RepID=A0A397UQI1_9GLOM|nr:hypothetical protein C2G38_2203064 [Gigaspora rosea]